MHLSLSSLMCMFVCINRLYWSWYHSPNCVCCQHCEGKDKALSRSWHSSLWAHGSNANLGPGGNQYRAPSRSSFLHNYCGLKRAGKWLFLYRRFIRKKHENQLRFSVFNISRTQSCLLNGKYTFQEFALKRFTSGAE